MTDSTRGRKHRRFGALMRRAMEYSGVKVADLARNMGVDHSTIVDWRAGSRLPRIENAAHLSDKLLSPALAEYVAQARTMECADCGRAFIFDNVGGRPRQFCSQRCARRAWGQRKSEANRKAWGHVHSQWRWKYERAQDAIDEMCGQCVDWEGVCRTPECPLRDVSPLPLAKT